MHQDQLKSARPWRSAALRYGAALLLVLAAAGLQWALQPVMGAPSDVTFYVAIVAAAAIGGFGPGLFATAAGGLIGIGVATTPLDTLQLAAPLEQVRLAIYFASGVAISLIAGAMHTARRRAHAKARELRRISEELRLANERLLQGDRNKDDFLAVLSHELRNPLMPIKHGLYILERSGADAERAQRALQTIARQVDQMTRLVNDLLDVTRITRDKLALQRDRIDLRQVVSRVLEDHREVFAARSITLQERQPQQAVWVRGDASRLSQVLGNLLHNAAKFTARSGRVQVTLEQRDMQAVVRVKDNGIGISAQLLGRIFDPFAQAERKLDRGAGGLGLGLTLVKTLVELHGGRVQATSEGEGSGAEFAIVLPIDTGHAAAAAPVAPAAGTRERRRVLVIEDNVDSADILGMLLKTTGHEVDVCYSGDVGVDKARSFHPDTVLCDIGLPGMDGYEVARTLRREPALHGATLVALTGYASREDRERALAAGFDRHLVKPPTLDELEQVLGH